MVHHNFQSSIVVEMTYKQHLNPLLMELKESVLGKINESFSQGGNGVLSYQRRLFVSNIYDLRIHIFEEAHGACYPIHRGYTTMYHDLT